MGAVRSNSGGITPGIIRRAHNYDTAKFSITGMMIRGRVHAFVGRRAGLQTWVDAPNRLTWRIIL
jgi:hypothetical protein